MDDEVGEIGPREHKDIGCRAARRRVYCAVHDVAVARENDAVHWGKGRRNGAELAEVLVRRSTEPLL